MQKCLIPLLSIGLLASSSIINTQPRSPIYLKKKQNNNVPVAFNALVNQASHFLAGDDKEEEQITQAILGNFADMVSSFICIVKDPHDPENIAGNVGNMIADIGHIVAEALKRSFIDCNIPTHMQPKFIAACKKYMTYAIYDILTEKQ